MKSFNLSRWAIEHKSLVVYFMLVIALTMQSFLTCTPVPVWAAAAALASTSASTSIDRYAHLRTVPSISITPIKPIPAGDDNIAYVAKGAPAPFDGYLYSPDTALRWSNYLDQYQQYRLIDVQAQRKVGQACNDASLEAASAERTRGDRDVAILRKENDRLSKELYNPPWYRTGTFYFMVGGLSFSVVFAAAFFIGSAFKH